MTNYEKYRDEIIKILSFGVDGGLAIQNGKPIICDATPCDECDFGVAHTGVCDSGNYTPKVVGWLNAEYVEPPKLTEQEKAFLVALHPCIKFIARNKDGSLDLFQLKPEKRRTLEDWGVNQPSECLRVGPDQEFLSIKFDFIKWEDSEPWSVEDLLKLEVEE
jgi:hypothetical protein